MNDCIFCKIANGEIPSNKVYENEFVCAFLDLNPDSDGHTLIVPKKHIKDINDIDENSLLEIYRASLEVKKLLEEKLNCDGMIYQQNNGTAQEVKHFHLHLKPFYKDNQTMILNKVTDKIKDPNEIYEIIKEQQ